MPLTSIDDSIERALKCLHAQEVYTKSAQRCRKALKVLQDQIVANSNSGASHNTAISGIMSYSGVDGFQAGGCIPVVDES